MKRLILVLCLASVACASAPPNLSPAGSIAFQNTRIIRGLDVLRDIAIDANAQTPPLLSTNTTRKVVLYHEATIKTVHARSAGWQAASTAGLNDVIRSLPPAERQLLAPYVALLKTILEVTR